MLFAFSRPDVFLVLDDFLDVLVEFVDLVAVDVPALRAVLVRCFSGILGQLFQHPIQRRLSVRNELGIAAEPGALPRILVAE